METHFRIENAVIEIQHQQLLPSSRRVLRMHVRGQRKLTRQERTERTMISTFKASAASFSFLLFLTLCTAKYAFFFASALA
jgi:hypothetical protein